MSEEIKKGSDKYLMFAEDLQERMYKFGFDYVVDLIKDLQQKVEQLEKENKRLKEWKEDLLSENIELENIRKEAIEYINKPRYVPLHNSCIEIEEVNKEFRDLLNILNKGSEDSDS